MEQHRTYQEQRDRIPAVSVSPVAQKSRMVPTPKLGTIGVRLWDRRIRQATFRNFSSHDDPEDLLITVEVAVEDLPGLYTEYEKQQNNGEQQRVHKVALEQVALSDQDRVLRYWHVWKACREEDQG